MKNPNLLRFVIIFFFAFGFGLSNQAYAQNHQQSKPDKEAYHYPAENSTTYGTVTVEGEEISYKAIAGTIPLFNDDRDTTAHIFFVGYFKKGVDNPTKRPVTFFYNGGPGSSTMWLHMGSFGPVRIAAHDTAWATTPPFDLVNNNSSLLDVTDLVFIDAPGTGFSRLTPNADPDNFFGVDQDAHAFAQFIVNFITKYHRWNSPKYLFGESYGTTRNAVLSNILTSRRSVGLNGVIMLSEILNFGNSIDGPKSNPGNFLPYVLALPTYAATAWYHGKLPNQSDKLKPFLQEVINFATGPYTDALLEGNSLSDQKKQQIAQQLHKYIGLPVDYILKADLRIAGGEFEKHLLAEEGAVTGRLDTRFRGPAIRPLINRSFYDPQSANISPAYVALFNRYVRHTLHYGQNMHYRPSYRGGGWDFDHGRSMGLNVMPDLAHAMTVNKKMDVLLLGGYYDLATPYYEGYYEMHHLPIPEKLQNNITYHYYKSGHMVYVNPEMLPKLHDDVAAFIRRTDNIED